MAPSKDALPPSETTEQDYFAIARRQADALNSLEAQLAQQDGVLRELIATVGQAQFRLDALEAKPVVVDYGDAPRDPARPRPNYQNCPECNGPLPNHFDDCSSYVAPKERAA